jgi:succinyl-CoA synthetase beta subunit
MNIHEYQAKELLAKFGVPVPAGYAAMSADEAVAAAGKLPGPLYVVKSQIHAGGRGKGKFKELGPDAKGGVRLARSADEVRAAAQEMLGNTLVTIQTGAEGKQVKRFTSPTASTSPRNSTSPCWSIATAGGSRSSRRPRAGWTSRRSRTTRPRRSRRSRSIRSPA